MRVRESASRPASVVLTSRPRRTNTTGRIAVMLLAAAVALAAVAAHDSGELRLVLKDMRWLGIQALVVTFISALLWLMWRSTDQRLVFDECGVHFSTSLPAVLKWSQPDWSIPWSELRGVTHGRVHPQVPNLPVSVVFAGASRDREVSLMLPWQLEGDAPRPVRHFYWKIEDFIGEWVAQSVLLAVLRDFGIDASTAGTTVIDRNAGVADQ